MPVVALVLFAVFGLLGFGWRSWLQHRRTGSTGFRGVSGRVGSAEWFAGVGFVVAMAAAFFAPVLQLAGLVSPLSLLHAPWIQFTGIAFAVIGIAATVYAQVDMATPGGSASTRPRRQPLSARVFSGSCATRSSPRCSCSASVSHW